MASRLLRSAKVSHKADLFAACTSSTQVWEHQFVEGLPATAFASRSATCFFRLLCRGDWTPFHQTSQKRFVLVFGRRAKSLTHDPPQTLTRGQAWSHIWARLRQAVPHRSGVSDGVRMHDPTRDQLTRISVPGAQDCSCMIRSTLCWASLRLAISISEAPSL